MPILGRRRAIEGPIRAPRVPLQTSVEFRGLSETDWHKGTTENISCTGLLFRTLHPVEPDMPVALRLVCPAKVCGSSTPQIVARGHVTRLSRTRAGWLIAAAITEYRVGKLPAAVSGEDSSRRTADGAATQHRLLQLLTIVQAAADMLAVSHSDSELLSWVNKIRYAAAEAATLTRSTQQQ